MKTDIISTNLYEFAYIPSKWFDMLNYLSSIAIKENWKYKNVYEDKRNQETPILENYIYHTFSRLAYERNRSCDEDKNTKIFITDNIACFNTGLFNRNYKPIYTFFEKNNRLDSDLEWVLKGFHTDSSQELIRFGTLPSRANYFDSLSDLIYDTKLDLRINTEHILDNPTNRDRIPKGVRHLPTLPMLFEGAVQMAKKKIEANYNVAVPQYYQDQIQFLIPISLLDMEKVDLVLAVTRRGSYYTGTTCLTMDMAYNNARLIAKPSSEWLGY